MPAAPSNQRENSSNPLINQADAKAGATQQTVEPGSAPHSSSVPPVQYGALRSALELYQHEPGGLLPALHHVQDQLDYIPTALIPELARAFSLSQAECGGVLSYYTHFLTQPPARHTLALCQAEACQARGGRALTTAAEAQLGCKLDHTRSDGHWHLESVACLGLCASGPALTLDRTLHARVDQARLAHLLSEADADQADHAP